ncbi:MAG: hypothetical protein ACT4R6_03805 [Gemmatimonadaceae bacterium]
MSRTGLLMLAVVSSVGAQQSKTPVRAESAKAAAPIPRNPSALFATQLLDMRRPGVAPRVRFSWEHMPGSKQYVLTGRWIDARSWVLRSQEFRVTPRNATRWESGWVTFDVSLAEGTHSWQLVAVFGSDEAGDFANPAHVSFDIR